MISSCSGYTLSLVRKFFHSVGNLTSVNFNVQNNKVKLILKSTRCKSSLSSRDEDILSRLIEENVYINECKSNKNRASSSLCSLIDDTLSQSDCIKLGHAVEKLLSDLVVVKSNLINIKPKNKLGIKERDHLFLDSCSRTIYYAELKGNLDLDTEKSLATSEKCLSIVHSLSDEYPDHDIEWCLLGYRYLTRLDIPLRVRKKYSNIDEHLFGVNDYLSMLSVNINFNETTYISWLNQVAFAMLKS